MLFGNDKTSTKLIRPQAAIIVWNFNERITAAKTGDIDELEDTIQLSSEILYIRTDKQKSSPAGQFEFGLAPNQNWVVKITPGSWCALLMTQTEDINFLQMMTIGGNRRKTLKMLGRIHSVRGVVESDQETGARQTRFIITGEDWGSVFNTNLYIDPIFRDTFFDNTGSLGIVYRMGIENAASVLIKKNTLPTPNQMLRVILDFWGKPLDKSFIKGMDEESFYQLDPLNKYTSSKQFMMPDKVVSFLGGGIIGGIVLPGSSSLGTLIKIISGVLTGDDKYGGDPKEAHGFIDPQSLFGVHTLWQILCDNNNNAINEIFTDIRWDSDKATLALYNRVKPFINSEIIQDKDDMMGGGAITNTSLPIMTNKTVKKLMSHFSDIKKIKIDLSDVVSINYGTNWRDKVNFIELRPTFQQQALTVMAAEIKAKAQIYDAEAYQREGFRPMFQNIHYFPYNSSGTIDPIEAMNWKFLMKEWYFNTHLMFNGSVTIIGQDDYIGVGDNIMIPVEVLGDSAINQVHSLRRIMPFAKIYFLAHVESVSHNFMVDQSSGARSFTTTINFVRGIISDGDGQIIWSTYMPLHTDTALDKDADKLSSTDNNNVIVTPSDDDPNALSIDIPFM